MNDTATISSGIGHNSGIIAPPEEAVLLADLERRYADVATDLDGFEAALKEFPKSLKLEDIETAAALQDLLGKLAKHRKRYGADKKSEKSIWDKPVKIIQNFFAKAEDKIKAWEEEWSPVHEAFLELKKADEKRKADEEAERQRKIAEEAQERARKAEEERLAKEEEARLAREAEEKARREKEEAEKAEREAKERRAAAEAEEKRIAEERKQRDREEKERNADGLKKIRDHMKDAETYHRLAEVEEAEDHELELLDVLVKPGGTISTIAGPIANSHLLTDEQREKIAEVRERLTEMRAAQDARFNKREQKKREKARAEEEERQRIADLERQKQRQADEEAAAKARAEREKAEQEAEDAKERKRKAAEDAKAAEAEAKGRIQDARVAGREVKHAAGEADRAENRADRADRRAGQTTDAEFSRLRGDYGTVGSLSGRWKHEITDDAALRATLPELGAHFTDDALSGAVYRWMAAHRDGWDRQQKTRITDALPGVLFYWETEVRNG